MNRVCLEAKKYGYYPNMQEFERLFEMLASWNEKFNLTRIISREDVIVKHFLDSLSLLSLNIIKDGHRLIDIGCGAGFPGLPLKLVIKSLDCVFLDASSKKLTFIQAAANELALEGVEVLHKRCEEAGQNNVYREKFDIVTARAVAALSTLAEYALPLVKVGGHFICMKSRNYQQEVDEAQNAIKLMGGVIEDISEIIVGHIPLSLIVINKAASTPHNYPRNAPKPSKQPIISNKTVE